MHKIFLVNGGSFNIFYKQIGIKVMPDNNRSELGTLLSGLLQNKNLKRKLEAYADRVIRKRTKNEFARHLTPSDYISSVSLKFLNGSIHWDRKACSLASFFFNMIRTEVFNQSRKEKKFIPVPLLKSETFNDYDGEVEEDISEPQWFIIDPFEDVIDEEGYDPLAFKNLVFELLNDLPEEYLVFEGISNGLQTRQICLDLGLTKDQVHNIKRRIKRIVISWIQRNKKKNSPLYKQLLINNSEPLTNTSNLNKAGRSIPENNNEGELI
jgi:hypothetical protein